MNEVYHMIDSFNFNDFLNSKKDNNTTIGAWIIVTDSQCILGYTDYEGLGYHSDSLMKTFQILLHEDRYSPLVSPRFTNQNYLIGIMMSGSAANYILFDLDQVNTITPNQKKLFDEMASKYDEVVKNKAKELGQDIVIVKSNDVEYTGDNLSFISDYLKVNEDKQIPYDFCNIGQLYLDTNKVKIKEK